ncbi:MAG: AraC family transcriptional regulator [Cellulosilyticaceae bacterium]
MKKVNGDMKEINEQEKDLYVYQAGWERCESNHAFGPAIRDHYLIHYIVKGKGKYKVRDTEYILKEGDGFLIWPEEVTFYQADNADPWEYYWIGFRGKDVEVVLKQCCLSKENLVFHYNQDEQLRQILHQLYLSAEKYNVNEYEQIGYAYLFLSVLNKKQEIGIAMHHQYINKAVRFIEYNYSYDITITQIANHVGIERTYLFRLFKKTFNSSPQEYLIKVRLSKGAEILMQSEAGITEVAYSCGFKEIGYFSRCFKKHYHISPSQYRKNYDSSIRFFQ